MLFDCCAIETTKKKTTKKNALSEFVPSLRFKSGTPDFSPSPSVNGGVTHEELSSTMKTASSRQRRPFKGEAAVIDASFSTRGALICMRRGRGEETAVILN